MRTLLMALFCVRRVVVPRQRLIGAEFHESRSIRDNVGG